MIPRHHTLQRRVSPILPANVHSDRSAHTAQAVRAHKGSEGSSQRKVSSLGKLSLQEDLFTVRCDWPYMRPINGS